MLYQSYSTRVRASNLTLTKGDVLVTISIDQSVRSLYSACMLSKKGLCLMVAATRVMPAKAHYSTVSVLARYIVVGDSQICQCPTSSCRCACRQSRSVASTADLLPLAHDNMHPELSVCLHKVLAVWQESSVSEISTGRLSDGLNSQRRHWFQASRTMLALLV